MNAFLRWWSGTPQLDDLVSPTTGEIVSFRDCPYQCWECLSGDPDHTERDKAHRITRREYERDYWKRRWNKGAVEPTYRLTVVSKDDKLSSSNSRRIIMDLNMTVSDVAELQKAYAALKALHERDAAEHLATTTKLKDFIEDFAKCSFDCISGRALDPQDDQDDVTPLGYVQAWQEDATALLEGLK